MISIFSFIKSPSGKNLLAAAVILFLIMMTYSNSLHNQFLMDDYSLIVENPKVHSLKSALTYFFPDSEQHADLERRDYYRPFNHFFLALSYHFFGVDDPYYYHLVSLILFFAAVMSVYGLILFLWGDFCVALLTAVFFAVHPINGLMVNYITAVVFSLEIIFMNLALILILKATEGSRFNCKYFSGGIVFFIAASLCHESALAFPVFLAAVYVYQQRKSFTTTLRQIAPVAILAAGYFVVRLQFASLNSGLFEKFAQSGISLPEFFASLGSLYWWYAEKLLTGQGIVLMWVTEPTRSGWPFYINIVGVGMLVVGYLWLIIARGRESSRIRLSLTWLGIGLMLGAMGSLYYLKNGMSIEPHWLYFSSIGFFVILSHVILKLHAPYRWVVVAVVVSAWVLSSRAHNQLWKDEKTYAGYWHAQVPQYKTVLFYLGSAYLRSGDVEAARPIFEKALENTFNDWQVYTSLGLMDLNEGRLDAAEQNFRTVLNIFPKSAIAHNNLGVVFLRRGDLKNAAQYFKSASTLDRYLTEARLNLAEVMVDESRWEEARQLYQENLAMNPREVRSISGWLKMAVQMKSDKDVGDAVDAVVKNVSHVEDLISLAAVLDTHGFARPALQLYQKAIAENPDSAQAYMEAGKYFANHGYGNEAVSLWTKGKSFDPDNQEFDGLIHRVKGLFAN